VTGYKVYVTPAARNRQTYMAVIEVHPKEDFTLSVVFEDGSEGVVDMKPYLDFGVFRRIRDYDQFSRVRVAFDAVEWDCGVDLDPEFVNAKASVLKPAWPTTKYPRGHSADDNPPPGG